MRTDVTTGKMSSRFGSSYTMVAANDYRAALLLFYEQNNVSAFKRMFLEQVEFAVREYF